MLQGIILLRVSAYILCLFYKACVKIFILQVTFSKYLVIISSFFTVTNNRSTTILQICGIYRYLKCFKFVLHCRLLLKSNLHSFSNFFSFTGLMFEVNHHFLHISSANSGFCPLIIKQIPRKHFKSILLFDKFSIIFVLLFAADSVQKREMFYISVKNILSLKQR